MKSKKFWNDVLADVIANTLSAILMAILAIVVIDSFYSTPQLGGMWEFEIEVKDSSFSQYKDMKLKYQVILLQKELQFSGYGDKFAEKTSSGEYVELSGNDRSPIEITGYIEKNLLGPNQVLISINEKGSIRESATFHELTVSSNKRLEGDYKSTIADSNGLVSWVKKDD